MKSMNGEHGLYVVLLVAREFQAESRFVLVNQDVRMLSNLSLVICYLVSV